MCNNKSKVVLIERYLVFYRQELYRRLSNIYDLTFLYSGEQLGDLPELTGVSKRSLRSFSAKICGRRKIVWMSALRDLLAIRPKVVITEISTSLLSTWLLFLLRPFLGYRLLFWGHGLEDYWSTKPCLTYGDRLRLLWFRWSNGVIVYGHRGLAELRQFLPSHPNLVRSPNAQNSDLQELEFEKMGAEGRDRIRDSLGITTFAFVYIGRLAEGKGLERVPALAKFLQANGAQVEFHFIGSGQGETNLRDGLLKLGVKVVFHGTLTGEAEKGRILFACDCLLGPGPMGLAIVDALGYGCPVLALGDNNFAQKHGPEIEYVVDGESGFIRGTLPAWQDCALQLVQDKVLLAQLRNGAIRVFQRECLISRQIEGACAAIDKSVSGQCGT